MPTTVNDYYIGAELSVLSCDKFVYQNIDDRLQAEEAALFDTKWWDYRAMHPTQATLYFYAVYNEILPTFISKYISNREGEQAARYLSKKDLREQSTAVIRSFWKARQYADAIGCPYPIYIRAVLTNWYDNYHRFSTTKNGKQKVPFPTQISSDIMAQVVIKDWEERKQAELHLPVHDYILHKPVWFRAAMEEQLRADAQLTEYPDSYIRKAIKVGAILGPT